MELPTTRPSGSNPAALTSRNSLTDRSLVKKLRSRMRTSRSTPCSGMPAVEGGAYCSGSLVALDLAVRALDRDADDAVRVERAGLLAQARHGERAGVVDAAGEVRHLLVP